VSKPPDEIPWNVPAYIADTTHLTTIQHGAYILILFCMWRHGGKLQDDDRILAAVAKLPVGIWKRIMGPIRALLMPADEPGFVTQKRLSKNLSHEIQVREKNSASAKLGGIAKALKSHDRTLPNGSGTAPETATRTAAERQPVGTLPEDPALRVLESSFKDSGDSKKKENKSSAKRNSGEPLPDGWEPTEELIQYGIDLGFSRPDVLGFAEDLRIWAGANAHRRDTWKAGAKGWALAFQGWMRRRRDEGPKPKAGRPAADRVTPADLASGKFRRAQ
jgi:uncharacterized protein YdaU (DUF1376 family)